MATSSPSSNMRVMAVASEVVQHRNDRLDWVADHRADLVLKPTNDYGGKGVVLGWEVDQAAWEPALKSALESPHIVQRRVPVPEAVFPSIVDGRLDLAPRLVDVDPYVWGGTDIEGGGVRLSTSSLLNVSAGGGSAVPLMVLDDMT